MDISKESALICINNEIKRNEYIAGPEGIENPG